jgi:hypothetical protein
VDLVDLIENDIKALSFFVGLEQVGFWPKEYYHDQGDLDWKYVVDRKYASWNEVAESVVVEFKRLFQKHKEEDPKCINPRVVLRRAVLDKCLIEGCCY